MSSIRQICLTAPAQLECRESIAPEPGEGEVLIRVGQVGICGSDMHLYRHGDIGGIPAPFPWILGHECMGTVAAVGNGTDASLLGKRVAVEPHRPCGECYACKRGMRNACLHGRFLGLPPTQGALSELLAVRQDQAVPIPDSVSDGEAVLLEPLAIALHAIRLVDPQPGEPALILGTGVLGTCVLVLLKQIYGIDPICVDLLPERLDRANTLGASAIIRATGGDHASVADQVMDLTSKIGAVTVFECAGVPDTFRVACLAAAPGGRIAVIGIPDAEDMGFPASPARRKGLTIQMVRRSLDTLRPCLGFMAEGRLDATSLLTHTFSAARAAEAFDLVERRGDNVLKAVVDMRG